MTEPRLMTVAECEEKLAAIDAAHEKAVKALRGRLALKRQALLAEHQKTVKAALAGLTKPYQAARKTLQGHRDCMALEKEQ
jgi:hypothetical protein